MLYVLLLGKDFTSLPFYLKNRQIAGNFVGRKVEDRFLNSPLDRYMRILERQLLKRTPLVQLIEVKHDTDSRVCFTKACQLINTFQKMNLMTDHFGRM